MFDPIAMVELCKSLGLDFDMELTPVDATTFGSTVKTYLTFTKRMHYKLTINGDTYEGESDTEAAEWFARRLQEFLDDSDERA